MVLDCLLIRSKNRPLDVFLEYPQQVPKNQTLRLWNTLISFVAHMHRCRSLTISAGETTYKLLDNICGPYGQSPVPLLASLSLTCTSLKSVSFARLRYDDAQMTRIYTNGVRLPAGIPIERVKELELRNMDGVLDNLSEIQVYVLERLTMFNVVLKNEMLIRTPHLKEIFYGGHGSHKSLELFSHPATVTIREI